MSSDIVDRRDSPRYPARLEIQVAYESRDELKAAFTKDISHGGLFILTDQEVALQDKITVHLAPEGTQGIRLEAEVVYVLDGATAEAAGQKPGVGVQFVAMGDEARQAIRNYVDGLTQDILVAGEKALDKPDEGGTRRWAGGLVPRILIVEDEEDIRRAISIIMKRLPAEVVEAPDGRKGIDVFMQGEFDLAIVDGLLPRVHGLEVIKKIRAVSDIPIMVVTALFKKAKDQFPFKAAGANVIVEKPFTIRSLRDPVRELLGLGRDG